MEFSNKKVLVVVAHPDDEILGCGATIHSLVKKRHCEAGVCMLSKGVISRFTGDRSEDGKIELAENMKAMKTSFAILGYKKSWEFDFPDNQFDSVNLLEIVKAVEAAISEFNPDVVLTHHHEDLNIDHRISAQAVFTAARPIGDKKRQVLTFETPSSSEWQIAAPDKQFVPNMFYELSENDFLAKIKAMEAYKNEIREYPHPRSAEALQIIAKRWGTVAGMYRAEAFNVLRWYVQVL